MTSISGSIPTVNILPGNLSGEDNKNYKVLSCTIQSNGIGGWEVVANDYSSTGLNSVSSDNNKITLTYDFTPLKVISLVCTPNDEFVKEGYTFSTTPLISSAEIRIHKNAKAIGAYVGRNSGAWEILGGTSLSAIFSSNILTITHESMDGMLAQVTGVDGTRASITSITPTETSIKFYNSSGSLLSSEEPSMKVYFSRFSEAKNVDPTTLDITDAKVQVFGLFEVN